MSVIARDEQPLRRQMLEFSEAKRLRLKHHSLQDVGTRFPGLRTNSARRTMPKIHVTSPLLVLVLDSSTAGELIPELACYSLQQLVELEATALI